VSSNQAGLHPRLAELVRKHLAHAYRPPVSPHNLDAYARLRRGMHAQQRPLVLDSFCGTGHSTETLARRHPGHFVVGVDKSSHRLARGPQPDARSNYLLLRADCEAIWQLLAADAQTLDHHYLLYPNPWPKSAHLKRRVHGHPAFAALLALGGALELRSNWQLYVEEFRAALALAGRPAARVQQLPPEVVPLSRFEQKYRDSGHPLWCLQASLAP
tara:strand:- start:1915 stop:2559 length:645 start_codon:yes stop_codon:yes gene_type:complete